MFKAELPIRCLKCYHYTMWFCWQHGSGYQITGESSATEPKLKCRRRWILVSQLPGKNIFWANFAFHASFASVDMLDFILDLDAFLSSNFSPWIRFSIPNFALSVDQDIPDPALILSLLRKTCHLFTTEHMKQHCLCILFFTSCKISKCRSIKSLERRQNLICPRLW